MGFQAVVVAILALLAIAVVVYGAFSSRKSIAIALIALVVATLAIVGGWHTWAESGSLLWTSVYGLIAVATAAVGVRHLVGRRSR